MPSMDIFNNRAFSTTSLTAAVNKVGYIPGFLGSIPGLFFPKPVRTEDIWIESRSNAPALIQTSPRGTPPKQRSSNLREARGFKTVRIAEGSRITASQLLGIRAFGSETELQSVQEEVAQRQADVRGDVDLTLENLRLGCVQGVLKDADGSVIYDWAAEFGQSIPTEVDFALDEAVTDPIAGVLRKKCNDIIRTMMKNLKGLGGANVRIMALAGDNFWDDLTGHPEVRETYLFQMRAKELAEGNAWSSFDFGEITWINYRGSDDGAVAVDTNKAKFFPVGAGIFPTAFSPGESFEMVGTMGKEVYSHIVTDKDRNAWADVEVYSYPLPVCTMPQALHRARRT